jgi:hypothetical protein
MTVAAFQVDHDAGYDRELADNLFEPDGREPAVDLLARALEMTRSRINAAQTVKARVRVLWAGAKNARMFAACDVHEAEFRQLTDDLGITRELGRHGAEDVGHVVRWAWRGWNPLDVGPLK